jgi:hypothetical protein
MEVRFSKTTLSYLETLTDILIEKQYFSFYETSLSYIEDIKNYILNNIQTEPKYKAPPVFSKFGKDLFYIRYRRSRQTIWYIFFTLHGKDKYLIRHITNNHVAAKYIKGL